MKPFHAALRCPVVRGLGEETPFREERARSFARTWSTPFLHHEPFGPLTMANV